MRSLTKENIKEKHNEKSHDLIIEINNSDNELDAELKNRILNLNLKPIEKKKAKNFSLLDYIGFIDENEVKE